MTKWPSNKNEQFFCTCSCCFSLFSAFCNRATSASACCSLFFVSVNIGSRVDPWAACDSALDNRRRKASQFFLSRSNASSVTWGRKEKKRTQWWYLCMMYHQEVCGLCQCFSSIPISRKLRKSETLIRFLTGSAFKVYQHYNWDSSSATRQNCTRPAKNKLTNLTDRQKKTKTTDIFTNVTQGVSKAQLKTTLTIQRRKAAETKSRWVLVLHLIGCKNGANFLCRPTENV